MPSWNMWLKSLYWQGRDSVCAPESISRAGEKLRTWVTSSSIRKRLLHGTFWSLTGTVVSRVLALGAAIAVARILGKTVYGELGIIQSTVGTFGTLAGFALGETAAKYVAEYRMTNPAKAGKIIALSSITAWGVGSILAAILFMIAPWLSLHTLAAPHLSSSLQIGTLLLLFSGISGAQMGVLSGFQAFKNIARLNLISGVISFPMTVCGGIVFGLSGILWGMVFAQAVGCLLNWRALNTQFAEQRIPISYSSCSSELPMLWRFSLPAVLATLVMSSAGWASAAMLVREPNGYAEMGLFTAANQWFNLLMWVPSVLGVVVFPMFSETSSVNDNEKSARLLIMSMKVNAIVVIPALIVGCVFSRLIMISYGEGFESGWWTLVIVLITAAVVALEVPVGQLIAASGHMWLGLFMNVGWAFVFLGGTWLCLQWGSVGLAFARLLAYLAHAVWLCSYSLRAIRFKDA